MITLEVLKKHWFQVTITLLIGGFMAMFYLVNTHAVNHEVEMIFTSRGERVIIATQTNNFKFMNEAFGEETARLNYVKIMQDPTVSEEVKRIVRLAYAEYLKE